MDIHGCSQWEAIFRMYVRMKIVLSINSDSNTSWNGAILQHGREAG